jgi:DNA-3-methyladenine glycosylase
MAAKAADAWVAQLSQPAEVVAPRLLGSLLKRQIGGREIICRIVETEAYDQSDAASHSYQGVTPRTEVMFGEAGRLYVYFTYGMHYCCNVVTGPAGHGSAILIRAVEPVNGAEVLARNRPGQQGVQLTNGPAKLCQALGITTAMNGHNLRAAPLVLELAEPIAQSDIVQTTRVGITKAIDQPWRFYLRGNPYVSKV